MEGLLIKNMYSPSLRKGSDGRANHAPATVSEDAAAEMALKHYLYYTMM
jgi:hypothetical protein